VICDIIGTALPEIRLEFRPQSAQLRPERILKDGFEFCSLQFERARGFCRAGKPVFMSPDLEKHRQIGVAHGAPQMPDEDLHRLWVVMEILANRKLDETSPQLLCDTTKNPALPNAQIAIHSNTKDKETSP